MNDEARRERERLARQIQACIRETHYLVATCPDDAPQLSALLALCDQALFSVKEGGRDGIASAGST